MPTILAAANAEIPADLPGLNLLPYLKSGEPLERNSILGESFAHDIADIENPEASLLFRWCIQDNWKLILTYDIRPEMQQDYFKFMIGRYVPVVQSMGLEMTDAYHTAFGDHPHRLIVFVAPSRTVLDDLLASDTWSAVNEQLTDFIVDLRIKKVPFKEAFQF